MILKKNLVFLGMMGSGKSSIGYLISKRLNLAFIDVDDLIEEARGMSISETLMPIFSTITLSISRNGRFNFLETKEPIEDLPDPIMPTKTRFLFEFINILY